ncbi:MAG: 2-polyprenyl-3-methyl-5-hydroxy-6-metoxy-1,4-benzoquinol methylase [Cellvibrionaceae bacterium]|jgi:2-polyprenyl-3-methyl-5-hydroxy-6-metoxy-1,4-benzoquinol methylase
MKNSLLSTTIDAQELEHFQQLADTWWDPPGHFAVAHSQSFTGQMDN